MGAKCRLRGEVRDRLGQRCHDQGGSDSSWRRPPQHCPWRAQSLCHLCCLKAGDPRCAWLVAADEKFQHGGLSLGESRQVRRSRGAGIRGHAGSKAASATERAAKALLTSINRYEMFPVEMLVVIYSRISYLDGGGSGDAPGCVGWVTHPPLTLPARERTVLTVLPAEFGRLQLRLLNWVRFSTPIEGGKGRWPAVL
jgi:hypothetical protein